MLIIRSSADLWRALDIPMNAGLAALLRLRHDQLTLEAGLDLASAARFVVAGPGDTLSAITAEAGYPLAGDEAPIEWAELHPDGWIEAAIITDDDGFAVVVIASPDCDPNLLAALLAHA